MILLVSLLALPPPKHFIPTVLPATGTLRSIDWNSHISTFFHSRVPLVLYYMNSWCCFPRCCTGNSPTAPTSSCCPYLCLTCHMTLRALCHRSRQCFPTLLQRNEQQADPVHQGGIFKTGANDTPATTPGVLIIIVGVILSIPPENT